MLRGLHRDEAGSAALEFAAVLPYLLLAALAAWQILLVTTTATSAENAARNGSRTLSMGGGGAAASAAARDGLTDWLRTDASVSRTGPTAVAVSVEVPIVFPGVSSGAIRVTRDANLPDTSDEAAGSHRDERRPRWG